VKAAVLCDVGRIEVREVRCPDPGPRDVLLRVAAVGLCGTDWHLFAGHGNYHRDERGRPIPLAREPQILGHEKKRARTCTTCIPAIASWSIRGGAV
jgi:threonine dehydrogenase-like Zn-dependent dehydrogenase